MALLPGVPLITVTHGVVTSYQDTDVAAGAVASGQLPVGTPIGPGLPVGMPLYASPQFGEVPFGTAAPADAPHAVPLGTRPPAPPVPPLGGAAAPVAAADAGGAVPLAAPAAAAPPSVRWESFREWWAAHGLTRVPWLSGKASP